METIVDKHGVEYDIKQKVLIKASPELREEYIIHQNTEIIHPFAFMDCKKIESIVLPDKLQYIGTGSFLGLLKFTEGLFSRSFEKTSSWSILSLREFKPTRFAI